ncbi:carboxymuconolactone decarboxylase family protein [Streptomyces iconiensis]|uniref:Carboxymuconolactone decarboxylase family protein n=1 Tax=Streptomyces iconiensis TaxID=1384038 RepID=A0ABT7A0B6_9ACTN|nr:carboxymuconolactone decarboxylase family protein [Streptomyces iconiensis]MDJ1134746.1 carboxymuconolactone decarboxylase family protein [Streptomyces iconiensis]
MESRSITAEVAAGARVADPRESVPELGDISAALFKATGNRSIPRTTIGLLQLRAGQIVGNTYLTVLHTDLLRKTGESEERITAVASWQDAPYFTEPERAALALTEAVFQPSGHGERVPDELFAQVSELYDTKALATLMIAIGQVGFFVPLALIAKPAPGRTFGDEWA